MNKLTALSFALLLLTPALIVAIPASADEISNDSTLDKTASIRTVYVDCDRGKTIERALRRRADRLIIEIAGTCHEDVLIARDDVTLRGYEPGATIVGGIRVEGSTRVQISGFTVRDSSFFESCIEAVNGSAVKITDMFVEGCAQRGIRIRDSVGEVADTTVQGAGDVGFLARGSALTLEGAINAIDNTLVGISITDGSNCFSKSGDLLATGGSWGIIVQLSSSLSNPEGTIRTSGNGAAGILVASTGSLIYGEFIESNNNAFAGIWVDENSTFSAFRGFNPTLNLSGNFFAAFAERSANLELSGNISITGNTYGVVADESLVRASGVNITGNAVTDALLRYGTRVNFIQDNTVGTLQCDADVSVRGDVACP